MSLTRSTRLLTTSKASAKASSPKPPQISSPIPEESSSPSPVGGECCNTCKYTLSKFIHNLVLLLWKTYLLRAMILKVYPQKSGDKPPELWISRETPSLKCMIFTYFSMYPVDKPVDKRGKICG